MSTAIDHSVPAIIDTSKQLGALQASKPEQHTINGIPCLVTNSGQIYPLVLPERYLDHPRRKRASVKLYEALSFINYVNAHKILGRTHLFARATELGASFTAIIDYHDQQGSSNAKKADDAPAVTEGTPPLPILANFGEHIVVLDLETTPEWRRWVQNDRKLLSQEAFAEFLEDNMNDIVEPDAATLVETSQLLQGKKTVNFKGGRNLRSGAIALEYVEDIEITGGGTNRQPGQMQVPDKFTLGLTPFIGANGVQIEARLRFRIGTDGKLAFMYVLNRPYEVIETAFNVARDDIERATGLDVLLGNGTITQG